jgi:hypothetical protein
LRRTIAPDDILDALRSLRKICREPRPLLEPTTIPPLGRAAGARSTGLGLTFYKLAVEAGKGEIGLESVEAGGERFWVELFRDGAR